ncbi:MAG: hypothetical protein HXX10_04945 [Rhodoplanes sp.]|nr:hypothetical protein [Rhodoplanes sp.]NVO13365.1 hypothetical protein [Rhodoplanes sp.]
MSSRRHMSGRTKRARRSAPVSRVVLDDHARLPGRFFGRLTAAILAGLR